MSSAPNPQSSHPDLSEVAELITHVTQAHAASATELADMLYRELRRMARAYMRRERREHTLEPTALANEAYLRLVNAGDVDWQGRAHFLGIAARTMRLVLVDHARRRDAKKRGGDRERLPLHEATVALGQPDLAILDLDAALGELATLDERKARVVEMRFFSGMQAKEIGEVLGIAAATVQDDWYAARAWLRGRLREA